MSVKQKTLIEHADARLAQKFLDESSYVYAGLDNAPLILDFELQLAQQRAADQTLRQIAAIIGFELDCVVRGIDPRARG